MKATVITDASWCPKTRAGGWAAWIRVDNIPGALQFSGQFKERPINSNIAEIRAAINGIILAYKHGARTILIQSDCTGVRGAVHNGKHGYPKMRKQFFPDAVVQYRHVKGHTDCKMPRSYVNRWCDKVARQHMKEQRNG